MNGLKQAPDPLGRQASRIWSRSAWLVVALFAIALFWIALGAHRIGDSFAETDFYGGYVEGARRIQQGDLDPTRYGVVGPVYEMALAAVGSLTRDLLLGAELISILGAVSALILWIAIVERVGGPRMALLAGLFMALNPTFFRYGYSATNDALALGLQAAAWYSLLTGRKPMAALAAGLLAGLAFLTRYNAVALIPAGLVAVAAGAAPQTRRGQGVTAFALGFLLLGAPWVAWSLSSGSEFAFQFHHNIAFDVFGRSQGIPWDDYQEFLQPQFRSLADVIARDPGAVVRRQLFNVFDHLRQDALVFLGLPVALCSVTGLVVGWLDGTLRRLWPVALWSALFFLTLVPIFYSQRYSLPLLPLYAVLAASPFVTSRLTPSVARARRPWIQGVVAAVILAMSLVSLASSTRTAIANLPLDALESAAVLGAQARPGDRVISRKPHVAYHAGVTGVAFPFTRTIPEFAAYAREKGARWLYFSHLEADLRPVYLYLLDTSAVLPGLTRRHTIDGKAILYEIGPSFGEEPAWLHNDTLITLHAMRARLWLDPRDVRALSMLAEYELMHGQSQSARARARLATALDPRATQAWLLLGHAAFDLGDPVEAANAYQHVLAIDDSSVAARVGLGWAKLASNDLEGAARAWRPVISSARDSGTLERMAAVFHALGDSTSLAMVVGRWEAIRR